ncbi:splicing factor 3B subunit 1-like [Dorcoceras hygrometricum]|uniref:Splicing factor 3B subunit 1-like n=1 Tax=Dorcoceras hygrometricum TaxID=472368 RepID=A0A2Z7DBS0_9LAMI|nr:splicing factor 3B subunit 1-like [Dorcoceras hygrometricum]
MVGQVRTGWTRGWSNQKFSGHGGRSREDEHEERPLPMRAAGVCDFRAYGSSCNSGVKWQFSGGVTYRDPEVRSGEPHRHVMTLRMRLRRLAVRTSEHLLQQYPLTAAVKMASFTTPIQFLQEPLRSGEDDDMSGFKQPSKIIESSTKSDEESISIEYILKQIPEGMMLPSLKAAEPTRIKFGLGIKISKVNKGDWFKASLPRIATSDKGKAPLVEKDEIKEHPVREMFSLICADVDFLVKLREKVIADVVSSFYSFSLSKLADLDSVKDIIVKENRILAWAETDSLETAFSSLQPYGSHNFCRDIVAVGTVVDVAVDPVEFVGNFRRGLDVQLILSYSSSSSSRSTHPSASASASQRHLDTDLISPNPSTTDSRILFNTDDFHMDDEKTINQILLPTSPTLATTVLESLAQLRTFVSQLSIKQMRTESSIGDLRDHLLSKIDHLGKSFADAHSQHDQAIRGVIKSVRQDVQTQKAALSFELFEFKKGVRAHSAIVTTDLADIRKDVKDQKSTRCVLGKWVYLVTHAMSLFDLQDVCVVIGSLSTLDSPMVVDLIGIYVLKGPYCTLTMTDWFLQALSVIPRGTWGDVARRFTMIRWVRPKL